jgi:heme-degrading monooxygenase HmoA
MTHLRLWKFEVAPEHEERFVAAYRSDGDWARLFSAAPGFLKTELWRSADGSFLTADHWGSEADFDRFQQSLGEEYHRLDAELEEVAGVETFLGAFDLAG